MAKTIYSLQSDILRGEIIRIRKKAKLTQRDLAKLLEREQNYVARLEVGERRLDIIELFWICRACKIDPSKVAEKLMRKFTESSFQQNP